VKRKFREDSRLNVLTKKPVTPDEGECEENPRARSAKMRAAERKAG
jgi:16S rRNA (cytosine1402-N4)-methyltransferase